MTICASYDAFEKLDPERLDGGTSCNECTYVGTLRVPYVIKFQDNGVGFATVDTRMLG